MADYRRLSTTIPNNRGPSIRELSKKTGVYALVNQVTGRIYVGSSIHTPTRRSVHFRELKHHKHPNWKLQRDAKKFGVDSFSFIILEECSLADVKLREQFWLDKLEAVNRGYNILAKTVIATNEARLKMGAKKKGRVFSLETRTKMSIAKLGKKLSAETKAKMSVGQSTRKPHSLETRQKIGAAHRGKIVSSEARKKMSDAQKAFRRKKLGLEENDH